MYAAADVVVSLCETDGTPVSVLEAMALGRPIVALENPSVAEWVSDPGGRLIASLEPDQLATVFRGYLTDAAARERAAAHNLGIIAERAERSTQMSRMEQIYSRLVAERPANGGPRGG
jgi:glycosyltransferase involved in cell wall biosynthesis